MRRRSGFTLLELILVVAILGIMVGVVAIRMDSMVPKYRLRGAAREVGANLKLAKSRAASTGRNVYVAFDVSEGKHWLLVAFPKLERDGTPKEPVEFEYQEIFKRALPSGVKFVDVLLSPDQKVEQGKAMVRVSPFGLSNHVVVNLRGEDKPMAVRMNGLTGMIAYFEEYREFDETVEERD